MEDSELSSRAASATAGTTISFSISCCSFSSLSSESLFSEVKSFEVLASSFASLLEVDSSLELSSDSSFSFSSSSSVSDSYPSF